MIGKEWKVIHVRLRPQQQRFNEQPKGALFIVSLVASYVRTTNYNS